MKTRNLILLLVIAAGCGGGSSDPIDAGSDTADASSSTIDASSGTADAPPGEIDGMDAQRSVTRPEVASAMWLDLQSNVFDLPIPGDRDIGDVADFLVSCPDNGNIDVTRDNDSSVEPTVIDVRFDTDDCAGTGDFSYNGFVNLSGSLADDGTFTAHYAADMYFQVTADTADACPMDLSFTVDSSGTITASSGTLCGHDVATLDLSSPGAPALAVENSE